MTSQVDAARVSRGLVLINQGGSQRAAGFALLAQFREANLRHGYAESVVRTVDTEIAKEKARTGDVDGAIELARAVVDYTFDAGDALSLGEAVQGLGGSTAAARHERRPQGGAGRDRPAGSGADRPGIRTVRGSAAAAAGSAGAGSRR